jgi:hypothetical protein
MARVGVNFVRCAMAVAFAVSSFAVTASASASVRLVPHDQNSTVTWTLVNAPCTPGGSLGSITLSAQAEPEGRACYDPAGTVFPSDFQAHEGSAAYDVPGQYASQFSYAFPDTVPPAGASLPLSIDTQELAGSASGFHDEFCVTGGSYVTVLQSDPCARAGTDVAFGTASGSATLTLDSNNASTGTPDIVTLGFQDGPHLYFDYHAGPTPRTTYHYSVEAKGTTPASTFNGHGTFEVPTGTTGRTQVLAPHGSMTAILHGKHGTHTVLLTLTRATFDPGLKYLDAFYRVTRSTLTCAPAGRQVEFYLTYDSVLHDLFESHLCHFDTDERAKTSVSP